MNKMTISIAMLTYNGEKYVLEQLKSISNQTILPDEIVICDDCSTDNTVNEINKFIEETTIKVKLFVNQKNIGVRKNSEKVYSLCNGDIIFLCDQDDVWVENKVETILKAFNTDGVVLCFSDGYVSDENLSIIAESEWNVDWSKFNNQEYFDYCQTRNFPFGHLLAFKRSFVNKIIPFLSDPDGWIAQCAPAFGDVIALPEKLMYYRRHSNAVSSAFIVNKEGILSRLKKLFKVSYQEYFTWPKAESITYNKLLYYVETNGNRVETTELKNHLMFLNALVDSEKINMIKRIKSLNWLFNTGLYQEYRGNTNALTQDKIFMIINSFTKK